jgi:NTE family protein
MIGAVSARSSDGADRNGLAGVQTLASGVKARRLNLALQGGGAHGAFTWGVLDRLLEAPELDLAWLSGTSAGAVNAVALAAGFAEGGREGAREKLRSVWGGVIEAGAPDLLRLNPFLQSLSRSSPMTRMAALFSPYEFNPLGFDPLRKLLASLIDFGQLRAFSKLELLIAATDVATGRPRLFRRAELTVDHVLASACLPTVHHAVTIEGRHYWDGGFSANPDLTTLASESPANDTLIVELNPIEKPALARTARDIAADVSRITFTQPLLAQVAEIVALQKDAQPPRWFQRRSGRAERIAGHRWHLIAAGDHTIDLPPDSKMRPDRALLRSLHEAGRHEADRWLDADAARVGRTSTVDLAARFLSPLRPLAADTSADGPIALDADDAVDLDAAR